MVGKTNEKHYIVASQDRDLQEKLRKRAGAPILYFHNKSPTLEKPSKASYDKVNPSIEANAPTFISETQNETLKKIKKALGVEEKVDEPKNPIKKRKQHNPNPLSCKKKKKKCSQQGDGKKSGVQEGKVRKRNKKQPSEIKEQLKSTVQNS